MKDMAGLGIGAFAKVDTDVFEGREVAVKRILDEYKFNENYTNRFKKEVKMLERLKGHPNIVPLIENRINENKDEYIYLMEKADYNLDAFIKQNYSKLSYNDKIEIFDQIVNALVEAHNKDILHRDLSPNNILINEDRHVWVADFGLGKDYSIRSIGGKSSIAGHGTPVYVAPEQLEKLNNATKKSDVYSLGMLFYFILTGKTPPPIVTNVEHFEILIQRATLYVPDGRYNDAIEFKDEYEKHKEFQSILGSDGNNQTLKEFLHLNPNGPLIEFHEVAMKHSVLTHDWDDFIIPITEKLKDMDTVYDYVEQLGDLAASMLSLFRKRLDKMESTGWDFNESYKVTDFALRTFKGGHINLSVQKQALELLWDWATIWNRFDAQDKIISILQKNELRKAELENHLAVYMLASDKTFNKLKRVNIGLINSSLLKRAILHLQKLDEITKEEVPLISHIRNNDTSSDEVGELSMQVIKRINSAKNKGYIDENTFVLLTKQYQNASILTFSDSKKAAVIFKNIDEQITELFNEYYGFNDL